MIRKYEIGNELFSRTVAVDRAGLRTVSLVHKDSRREYVRDSDVAEFQFSINGQVVRSYQKQAKLERDGTLLDQEMHMEFLGYHKAASPGGGERTELTFRLVRHAAKVKVCYETHRDIAGCTKWLEITALDDDLHLSNCFFEMLRIFPGHYPDGHFYGQQGLRQMPPMFSACGDEDILQFHDDRLNAGFWLGNGAPGPLRFFMVYPNWPEAIACGYSMSEGAFNVYLHKGDTLVTDKAYLFLYTGDRTSATHRNRFREMIRRDLPPCPDTGKVMYCTWLPFLNDINEPLLRELAGMAGAIGFGSFVVDDGWFGKEWSVNLAKFPHGLGPVVDCVKSAGMRFGLWYALGANLWDKGLRAENHSVVPSGSSKQFAWSEWPTWCLASSHREIASDELCRLAAEHRADYFKLDFSSIVSPYGVMPAGCSSTQHAHHRNAMDSVWEQYRSINIIRDRIKALFPDTMVDFSFECFGTQTPGIAPLRLSEWHHATNMSTNAPGVYGTRNIRETLYGYAGVLPAERILGSLITLQGENDIENLLTAFVGAPLVAGDLRRIPEKSRMELTALCRRYNDLIAQGPLTEFCTWRSGERIGITNWDGFARYRTDGTGMICVFKNESSAREAQVLIPDLPAGVAYELTDALTGEEIDRWTGEEFHCGRALTFASGTTCRTAIFRPARNR